MLKIKIAFISCSLSVFAQAQGYFNELYKSPIPVAGAVSIVETDYGYMSVGQMPTATDQKMIFYKLNFNGDTVSQKIYDDEPNIYYPVEILKRGSNFLVAGAIYKDTADIDNSDGFLALFDGEAQLIWIKYYGGPFFDNITAIRPTFDNGFVLTGEYGTIQDSLNDFYLIKTDSIGNVEWEKTYGSLGRIEIGYALGLSIDGGYIQVGSVFIPPTSTTFGNYDMMVIKVDSLGNQEWLKTFGTDYNDNAGGVIELNDKSLIIATGFGSVVQQKVPILLKIDSLGNLIWQKQFSGEGYSCFSIPIVSHDDQTLTLCGMIPNENNTPIGFITKIDTAGNEIWRREYEKRSDRDQYILDIKPTADGGYIFCGSAWDSVKQRAWIVKLDCFGCDSLLCYYQDSICEDFVSVPEIQSLIQEPSFYPNPNTGTFTLNLDNNTLKEAEKLLIFDLNGRLIWQETIVGTGEINTYLPTGLYVVEIPALGWRKKMVVE